MNAIPSKDHGSPGNREVVLDPSVHYVCQRCTACCKWPGDVRIEEDEIAHIAGFLHLTETAFVEQYTRLRTNRRGLSLIEKENHECIMLDGNACRIHPVKPAQCVGFPNTWNFPGWRNFCEAIPVPVAMHGSQDVQPYCEKVRVHLRDMMEIGQLDEFRLPKVPVAQHQRLQDLLEDPDG